MTTNHVHDALGQPIEVAVQREPVHSIELQRAKDGTYYWTLKIYACDLGELETAPQMLAAIDADLRDRFLPKGE